jgi:hypothetical protein
VEKEKNKMVDFFRGRKSKNANGGRKTEKQIRDNYQFNLLMRASYFRSVSKTVSIPED